MQLAVGVETTPLQVSQNLTLVLTQIDLPHQTLQPLLSSVPLSQPPPHPVPYHLQLQLSTNQLLPPPHLHPPQQLIRPVKHLLPLSIPPSQINTLQSPNNNTHLLGHRQKTVPIVLLQNKLITSRRLFIHLPLPINQTDVLQQTN